MSRELEAWLEETHPEVLKHVQELLDDPPEGKEDYDFIDHLDDNYCSLYNYFCEYK